MESTGLSEGIHYVRYRSGTMLPGSFKKRNNFIVSFTLDDHAHRERLTIGATVRQAVEDTERKPLMASAYRIKRTIVFL